MVRWLGQKTTGQLSNGQREIFLAIHVSGSRWLVQKLFAMSEKEKPGSCKKSSTSPIITHRPGELRTMDIVEYPLSSHGYRYCLVMVDHFTKWLELYPLRNQKSETIVKKVFDCWIPRHGAAEQIHHDRGKNLTTEMIQMLFLWDLEYTDDTVSSSVWWTIGGKY